MLGRQYRSALAAGLIASVAISAGGCGSQAKTSAATNRESTKAGSEYVEVLFEFRDAARANIAYDAYGYAEADLPDSQRAAIASFCVVVNRPRAASESGQLSDPAYFSKQVVIAARPEAEAASMAAVRRAVGKLQAVIEPRSLSPPLVKSYAKACY